MANFVETMRLKEMAEEDIYFARRDRELIEALRRNRRRERASPTTTRPGGEEQTLSAPRGR